ncbi:MAG TPA: glycoside hydrolase family 15 protein [Chloroflexota bacterium]
MAREYPYLSDYAAIGDSRSVALVSRDGSIDWCCWPRFDSPSIFARLLDWEKGGYWSVRPTVPYTARQAYLGPTNVLATTFSTSTGTVRVVDFMPALTEVQKRSWPVPFRQITRRIDGVDGAVEMETVFAPRPRYAAVEPVLRRRDPAGVACQVGQQFLHLRSEVPMEVRGATAVARFVVSSGERRYLALAYSDDAPAVYPNLGWAAERELDMTLDFWHRWSGRLTYAGPYRDAVVRSALALKLLAFAPSGAVVAAPTTSLPEDVGGVRNWDYRYCWLRDAAFTVRVFYDLGCRVEGDAFVQWLLHTTRLTHPFLQVVYDVYGEPHVPERTLDHLRGYRGSRPVRVGNAAATQFQLDVYGEVMSALERFVREGGALDRDTRGLLIGMANLVAERWMEPDHGIWEMRSGRAQHVHGKVMAWLALDRASRVAREVGLKVDLEPWQRVKHAIRATVLSRGFDSALGSFVRVLDGQDLDGSLLTLPLVGFIDGRDPRMVGTIEAIRKRLGRGDLVYRYLGVDDGLPGREGAFLACSFWLVGSLALAGQLDEAHALFGRLLARGGDLGLLPEEIDPESGAFLGNVPQGLTHVALVNAALTLQQAERRYGAGL